MDGIHDVGGMHGFGDVDSDDDGTFHHEWERLTFGMFVGTIAQGHYTMDEVRHAIERMDPAHYLTAPYYERWLSGFERLLVEKGIVRAEELVNRLEAVEAGDVEVPDRWDPEQFDRLLAGMREAYEAEADPERSRYSPGDPVRVLKAHPRGHTRCPRYVRGVRGVVEAERGTYSFPDAGAEGREQTAPVYNVTFDPADVWGPDEAEGDDLRLDLWEPYLVEAEPASDGRAGAAPALTDRT